MADEPKGVVPRGRRWPWVLGAALVSIALLAAAGYLYNLHWQRKVDALLASYRARGEPVTWEEVLAARDTLPADQNSALVFQDALVQIAADDASPGRLLGTLLHAGEPGARPSARTLELVRADLQRQEPVLAIIREGAALPSGVYPLTAAGSPYDMPLRHLAPLREAVQLCGWEGVARAAAADGAGAAESLIDARRLCASIGLGWNLTEELVRLNCDSVLVAEAEKSLALCTVPAEMLERLRQEFAQERSQLTFRPALLGERAMANYLFTRMRASDLLEKMGDRNWLSDLHVVAYDVVPGKKSREALFLYGVFDRYLPIAGLPLGRQAAEARRVGGVVNDELGASGWQHFLSITVLPALDRAFAESVRIRTNLCTADAALAVEQWRMEHGRWPESLHDLVPEGLKEVPADPFGTGPLRYVHAEDGVTVYSVGPDGEGDGAGGGDDIAFRLLDRELRGARQMTFPEEVRAGQLSRGALDSLGFAQQALEALGVREEDYARP